MKNTQTAQEIAQEIKEKMIPETFGKTFEQLKKDIFKSNLSNGYGSSDYFEDKKNGYSVFYTNNSNFENRNGKGAGYYARLNFCGYCKHIKLD